MKKQNKPEYLDVVIDFLKKLIKLELDSGVSLSSYIEMGDIFVVKCFDEKSLFESFEFEKDQITFGFYEKGFGWKQFKIIKKTGRVIGLRKHW